MATIRKKRKADRIPQSVIGLKGMYRINLVNPDGEIAGDTGWRENLITGSGITAYLTFVFQQSASSRIITSAAIGSLTSTFSDLAVMTIHPGSYATSLMTSLVRTSVTRTGSAGAETARFTASWASGATPGTAIANVALFGNPVTGSVFCIGTYASSSVATNQAINLTYDICFLASTS